MATPPLRQGTIAIASLRPQRGVVKSRTVAVFTPDEYLETATHIDVVMISGSYYPDDPNHIPLPCDGRTRLKKPSAIILDETDSLPRDQVRPTWGRIPDAERAEMLKGLKDRGKL